MTISKRSYGSRCVHFAGLLKGGPRGLVDINVCHVGVSYGAFAERGTTGWMNRLPCFKESGRTDCQQQRFPTAEEIEAHEAELAALVKRVVSTRRAILEHAQDMVGITATMKCPECEGGWLTYSIAASNGHIHARCSRPDCVSFIE